MGNYSQTVVAAAVEAREALGGIDDIAEVQVRAASRALQVMANDPEKWRPRTRETADHSMPYNTAVALMYGYIDESHFEEKYFRHNEKLLALTDRVKCSVSEEADRRVAEFNLCEMDVILNSGEKKSFRVEYHRGHWRNPMTDEEVEKKFRSLASKRMPQKKVDALLAQLWKLDSLRDVGALMRMTKCMPAAKRAAPGSRKRVQRRRRVSPARRRARNSA
jgi:2-methylcitrate dehydratase